MSATEWHTTSLVTAHQNFLSRAYSSPWSRACLLLRHKFAQSQIISSLIQELRERMSSSQDRHAEILRRAQDICLESEDRANQFEKRAQAAESDLKVYPSISFFHIIKTCLLFWLILSTLQRLCIQRMSEPDPTISRAVEHNKIQQYSSKEVRYSLQSHQLSKCRGPFVMSYNCCDFKAKSDSRWCHIIELYIRINICCVMPWRRIHHQNQGLASKATGF